MDPEGSCRIRRGRSDVTDVKQLPNRSGWIEHPNNIKFKDAFQDFIDGYPAYRHTMFPTHDSDEVQRVYQDFYDEEIVYGWNRDDPNSRHEGNEWDRTRSGLLPWPPVPGHIMPARTTTKSVKEVEEEEEEEDIYGATPPATPKPSKGKGKRGSPAGLPEDSQAKDENRQSPRKKAKKGEDTTADDKTKPDPKATGSPKGKKSGTKKSPLTPKSSQKKGAQPGAKADDDEATTGSPKSTKRKLDETTAEGNKSPPKKPATSKPSSPKATKPSPKAVTSSVDTSAVTTSFSAPSFPASSSQSLVSMAPAQPATSPATRSTTAAAAAATVAAAVRAAAAVAAAVAAAGPPPKTRSQKTSPVQPATAPAKPAASPFKPTTAPATSPPATTTTVVTTAAATTSPNTRSRRRSASATKDKNAGAIVKIKSSRTSPVLDKSNRRGLIWGRHPSLLKTPGEAESGDDGASDGLVGLGITSGVPSDTALVTAGASSSPDLTKVPPGTTTTTISTTGSSSSSDLVKTSPPKPKQTSAPSAAASSSGSSSSGESSSDSGSIYGSNTLPIRMIDFDKRTTSTGAASSPQPRRTTRSMSAAAASSRTGATTASSSKRSNSGDMPPRERDPITGRWNFK